MAISYVGGKTVGRAGITSTSTESLTDLTGGTDSAPIAGDLVIITCVVGSQGRNPAQAVSGYTALGQLNPTAATYDTSLDVSYKIMGDTPDTTFTLPSTGNIADAQRYTVQVFRGVDPSTPLDVSAVSATGTGTGRPNPGAATPSAYGAWVVICGGGAAATGASFTAPANFTTNFLTGNTADTNDATVGSGYWSGWTSGSVDPATYTGGSTNAANSWAAYTIVLRPRLFLVETAGSAPTGAGGIADAAVGYFAADGWQSPSSIVCNAEPGAYSVTGSAASLTKKGLLSAAPGSYTLTGFASTLLVARVLQAAPASYSLIGYASTGTASRGLLAGTGTYQLSGYQAALVRHLALHAQAGSYLTSGDSALLARRFAIVAGGSSYSISGADASFIYNRQIQALPAAYDLAPSDAGLLRHLLMQAGSGEVLVTGASAIMVFRLELPAMPGAYAVDGHPAAALGLVANDGSWLITARRRARR